MKRKRRNAAEGRVLPDLGPLYEWYSRHHRRLPFRESRDPYKIWVSEVMLQQTRVAAMLERYAAFSKKFPTVHALAKASEEEVVLAWQGLGYYSRARNLRRGAAVVVSEHGGRFPSDLDEALKIPGVGAYTAAAVLSIAYGKPHAVLDGNVRRVIARLLHPAGDRSPSDLAADLLGEAEPAVHNQAMMELGALVCAPKPVCGVCPLQKDCGAFQKGGEKLASEIPPAKRENKIDVQMDFFAIRRRGSYTIVRDPGARFLPDHWNFPCAIRMPGGDRVTPGFENARRLREIGIFRHTITKHRIEGHVFESEAPSAARKGARGVEVRSVHPEDLASVLASSLGLKAARILQKSLLP